MWCTFLSIHFPYLFYNWKKTRKTGLNGLVNHVTGAGCSYSIFWACDLSVGLIDISSATVRLSDVTRLSVHCLDLFQVYCICHQTCCTEWALAGRQQATESSYVRFLFLFYYFRFLCFWTHVFIVSTVYYVGNVSQQQCRRSVWQCVCFSVCWWLHLTDSPHCIVSKFGYWCYFCIICWGWLLKVVWHVCNLMHYQ